MPSISVDILAHAVRETLAISLPAVWRGVRGTLTPQFCDTKLSSWSARLLDRAQIELSVSGHEQLRATPPPYIVVSNHQSLYDIPVLFQALPFSLRMAAKKELFNVPIWGQAMKASGFVKIDRSDGKRAREVLHAAGARLRAEQSSLLIAPEGTRSIDGKLLSFRSGAFKVAKITGLPLLPVAISGTIKVHRSGELTVHQGQHVHVQILPALLPEQFSSIDDLRAAARSAIETALPQS